VRNGVVSTGSADWRNYKKSGYDEPFMSSRRYEFDLKAYNETFLTSNIYKIMVLTVVFGIGWSKRFVIGRSTMVYMWFTGGVLNSCLKPLDLKVLQFRSFYKIILDESNGSK
jgi:endonuclease G